MRPLIRRIPLQRKETKDETLTFSEGRVAVNVAAFAALETIVDPDDGTISDPQLVRTYRSRTRATERLRDQDETIDVESLAYFKAALKVVEEGRAQLLRLPHRGKARKVMVILRSVLSARQRTRRPATRTATNRDARTLNSEAIRSPTTPGYFVK